MLYDAILIDADDTLLDFQSAERAALDAILRALGLEDETARAAYHECNHACWAALERGELSPVRLRVKRFENFLNRMGRADEDATAVGEQYLTLLSAQKQLLPGALDVVRAIAAALPVAIVTNGIASVQHGRLDDSPLSPYVRAHVISEELGVSKPNPRMIHAALKALGGIAPCRALMVGDSLKSDIACARNAGVDACWVNARGELPPRDLPIRYEIRDIAQLPGIVFQS